MHHLGHHGVDQLAGRLPFSLILVSWSSQSFISTTPAHTHPASNVSATPSYHPARSPPRHPVRGILLLGIKASNLATLHKAALEPRLPPATLSTLVDDLDRLGIVVPGAKQVRQEAKVATATQAAALRVGYTRVKAVRSAVRKAHASKEVQQAYGVGQVVNPTWCAT